MEAANIVAMTIKSC